MANKCSFRKESGARCGANAQLGKTLCVFHDPVRADEGHRARRNGGINRSRAAVVLPAETPDNPLRNTQDVATLLAESINQVRRGQLDPRTANTIGFLAGVLLKTLEQGSIAERLAHLEAILGRGELRENFQFISKGEPT